MDAKEAARQGSACAAVTLVEVAIEAKALNVLVIRPVLLLLELIHNFSYISLSLSRFAFAIIVIV